MMQLPTLSILVLLTPILWAQTPSVGSSGRPKQLAKLFDASIGRGLFRGVVIVVDGGEVIFERAHGPASKGRRLTADSTFYLASLSKQFTATAIMLLRGRGRLSYDDPVARHVPELPAWAREVTIRHLLTNTSGLGDYLQAGLEYDGLTNAQVIAHLRSAGKPAFRPGDRYRYSNSGYVLLARIVERVSAQPFRSFTEKHIFKPLGMSSAVFVDETKPAIPRQVRGYDRYGQLAESTLLTNGAGGMYASARDLVRWCRAIFAARLMDREVLAEAFTPMRLNDGTQFPYGFGWHIHERTQGKVLHHTGGMAGFRNFLFADLERKSAVILLTNGGDSFPLPAMATAVTNILRDRPFVVPKPALCDHLYAFARTSPDGIRREARRIGVSEPSRFRVSEDDLNALGYVFLEQDRFAAARGVFEAAIDRYPKSANVYDSYAEALLRSGAHGAIEHYKKSLELDPTNENAKKMLRRIEQLGGS